MVWVPAMIVLVGHFNDTFLAARPYVHDVVGGLALFDNAGAWEAAWDDLFHCWCGCPM